jgi:drug/metabolite transporter (DMT)-like permease
MWQLYAFGSLVASAGENIIDKVSLVKNIAVDFLVASFWRSFFFFLITVLIGLLNFNFGPLHFSFNWLILLLAPIGVFSSIFYTYLLKKVEITSTTTFAYLAPILFLLIDSRVLHTVFSLRIIIGVILLAIGGVGFSINAKTRQFKPELTKSAWGMLLFNVFWAGCLAYFFKYLNMTEGLNGVSFFSSLWLVISLILLILICFKGKLSLLLTQSNRVYIKQAFLSKTFDAISTLLWAQALILVAVSRVSAFEALFPLILFILVAIAQSVFKLELQEKLDYENFILKVCATFCLVLGGFLVS